MSKHTNGSWFTLDCRQEGIEKIVISSALKPSNIICRIQNEVSGRPLNAEDEANAKHIVDCVNACKGLPDGCLDGGWTALGASQYAKKLETTNAELLEALELAIAPLELYKAYGWPDRNNVISNARSAIAKARGEANE